MKHPIETPLKYDEVPWEAGGLAGAPADYLQDLRGAKRHYAELYDVELPPLPATSGEEAPDPDPPKEPEVGEEPPTEKFAPVPASPEDADCAPLETRENYSIQTSSESDTRKDEEQREERRENRRDTSKKIETEIKAEPPNKIGNEGRVAALALAEATGRYDELARARLAQAAQYLISRGEVPVLRTVITRIARARRMSGIEIRDPLAYVARVIQDVRLADKLTTEERELAASVALVDASEATLTTEEEKRRRREEAARERRRGYGRLFDRAPNRSRPKQPAEGDETEHEPWEGSPFAGVVPPERWWQPATSRCLLRG